MISIYHVKGTRSMRIIWLCEELALPYETVPIDFSPAYRASPQWRALNPVGKVPAMSIDGFSMFESGAMLEHLLDRFGQGRLRPAPGTPQSARYLQWCWFAEATFARPLGDIAQHTAIKPPEQRIPAVVEDARVRALTCLDALDAVVPAGRYLLDGEFSAADIMMGYSMMLSRRFGVLVPAAHPNAAAYLDRLEQRPGYAKSMQ